MPLNLNFSQQAAVESSAQSLLITAGPGSGKTHTLIYRIARFSHQILPPQKILAITFTNKAAEEMRFRLTALAGDVQASAVIGTFHQFCVLILREYGRQDFSIASQSTCLEISASLWPDLSLSERKKRLEKISWEKAVDFKLPRSGLIKQFDQELRGKNFYDFDDLLLEAFVLLKDHGSILEKVQHQYPVVFVDEYQDINPIQHELLKLLIGPQSQITAIGDPDQAIYGFRGSSVELFHQFTEDFEGAQTIWLQENYRNAQNVLAASSQVIKKNAQDVSLEQIAKIHAEGRLIVHEALTDKAEAEYIVHTVEKLIGGTSMFSQDSGRVGYGDEGALSFGDIAVLYRLKSQTRELKRAFERSGMPFHISGSGEEAQDIEDDLFDQRMVDQDIEAEKIALMTLHAAKGLEFPCVFICGCEEGLLPLNFLKMEADPQEERRLFYVGMTRAKYRLYLTHAKKRMLYGQKMANSPSVFFADIEEALKNYSHSEFKPKNKKFDDGQMTFF